MTFLPFKKVKAKERVDYFFFGYRFLSLSKNKNKEVLEYISMILENFCVPQNFPKAVGVLRDVQLANIKLLSEVIRICYLKKMNYWLFFGSLLGAVRHQGYIPWDDDIDISMMRSDYEKFVEVFNENCSSGLFAERIYYKQWNMIKVRHKNIPSIFVDIFAFDFYHCPVSTFEEKEILSSDLKKIRKIYLKQSENLSDTEKGAFLSSLRDTYILKNEKVVEAQKPSVFIGLDFEWTMPISFFDYEDIFPLKSMNFENIQVSIPNRTDYILTYLYRDYMKIPKKLGQKHLKTDEMPVSEIIDIKNFIKEKE